MQCEFATDYFDHQTKDKISYECTETAESSKYCIFHDKENFKKNIQKINTGVKEKINYAILNNTAITMIGYNIAKIDISKKKFYNSVKFVKSIFHEEALFQNSEFLNQVDFSDVRFKKIAKFDESVFKKEVNFLNTAIKKQGMFTGCIFEKKVNFSSSILHNCTYSNCIFDEADFSSILFIGNIKFTTAIFKNKVIFNETKFQTVNFRKARFHDEVDFSQTKFRINAIIHNVIFLKPQMVYFNEDVSQISFLETDITKVRFPNEVIWNSNPLKKFLKYKTKNEKYKIYDERRLEKGFKNTFIDGFPDKSIDKSVNDFVDKFIDKFENKFRINFINEINDTTRNEWIDGSDDDIIDDMLYEFIDKFIKEFREEFIKKFVRKFKDEFADRFVDIFDDESINDFTGEFRDYFLKDLIEEFRDELKDCFLDDYRDELKDIFRDKFKDEFVNDFRDDSSKDFKDDSIEAVLDVYRNLRENCDFNLKYDKSREFFVREMNLKKNYEKSEEENKITLKKYFRRQISFLNVYNIIAQYGNSIYRPLYALTLIISIATISFFTDEFTNTDKILQSPSIQSIINSGIQSIIGFIPFTSTSNIPIRENITTTDTILKIIALPILGMLYIAFKRRFERTIRH